MHWNLLLNASALHTESLYFYCSEHDRLLSSQWQITFDKLGVLFSSTLPTEPSTLPTWAKYVANLSRVPYQPALSTLLYAVISAREKLISN